MDGIVGSLVLSLLLTLAFEIPFCTLVWGFRGRDIAVCALVNVVTNPPVVLSYLLVKQALTACGRAGLMPLVTAGLELAAVVVEWIFYRRCTEKRRPFFVSLSANAFSYFMGLALNAIL